MNTWINPCSSHNFQRKGLQANSGFLFASLIIITMVACSPRVFQKPGVSWLRGDLRVIAGYDALLPEGDLIAAYTRVVDSDFQFRFDYLELNAPGGGDLYIALDTKPGGTNKLPLAGSSDVEWDTLLVLPAFSSPYALSAKGMDVQGTPAKTDSRFVLRNDLIPRVIRIPWQDYILVAINKNTIPITNKGISIQAFSTAQDSKQILDSIGPFNSSNFPPQSAPVLLTFWNTFPAYSPAQSLRRWDGAHTGPFGERHGLSILLNNIQRFQVPAVLLDLRDPLSLSALDYIGAMPLVQKLVADKLLILPDLIPGSPTFPLFPMGLPEWAEEKFLQDLQGISRQFGLPASDLFYSPRVLEQAPKGYSLSFSPRPPNQATLSKPTNPIPLPQQIPDEFLATPSGLPTAIKKILLDNALQINLQAGETPLLILGGDLVQSAFSDPLAGAATLSYIANHPWIDPVNSDQLRSMVSSFIPQFPPGNTKISSIDLFKPSAVLQQFPNHFQTPLDDLAWQSALSLYAALPPESEQLPALRANYSGQPGILLAAASWSNRPKQRADCSEDLDSDGTPECVLASENQFTVYDLDGARLIAYFYKSESGFHQIIAPSSQFVVGLSDPTTWQLNLGEGADSAGLHGAFMDNPPPWEPYEVIVSTNQIQFTSSRVETKKTFVLSKEGISVIIKHPGNIQTQVPIAVDPWIRFTADWYAAYSYQANRSGYSFFLGKEKLFDVQTASSINIHSFLDTSALFSRPEDPNFEYPEGHYLPYPMAVVELESDGELSFDIHLPQE